MRSTGTLSWRRPLTGASLRHWPLWSLPRLTRAYVIAVVVAAAVALATAAVHTHWRVSQLGVFFLLLASAAAMVEATRDVKLPRDTLTRDLQEVWYLSIAVLLPPVYALLAPIPLTITKQWRVRRNLAHRRVFSLAANGLGYGAASYEFHSGLAPLLGGLPAGTAHSAGLLAAVIAAGVTGWATTPDGMALTGQGGAVLAPFNRWSNSLLVSHRSSGVDVQLMRGTPAQ